MLKISLIIILIFLPFLTFAQNNEPALKLDLPLFDLPYQIDAMNTVGYGFFSSYSNPSMAQSLAITADMFSGFHFGMKRFYNTSNLNNIWKNIIYYGGTAAGDGILMFFPFGGYSWMHEEYHRAVMSRFRVNSFNAAYTLEGIINHVTDEDLERFKTESPADFIRMQAAGIEGGHLLVDRLQRNNFFYNQKHFSELSYWISAIYIHTYIAGKNRMEGLNPNIEERDSIGRDPPAWVYDLFRPDEAYSGRGIHPSGIGINRYRNLDDLTDKERDYLEKVGYWQFINYVSPMMFMFRSLPFPNSDIRWNFAFRHFLTSFGTDLSFNVFLNIDKFNLAVIYHSYQNYEHYFPALEIEMIDFPILIKEFCLYFTPRLSFGIQPKAQDFFTSEIEFFGLIGSRFDFQIAKNWLPYFEFTAKTDGWVAGNEFLGKNINCRLGISARF